MRAGSFLIAVIKQRAVPILIAALCAGSAHAQGPVATQVPVAKVIARGAPLHGTDGLSFDKSDRLYVASFQGREIAVMDPESGKVLDRIGSSRGVETPNDVTTGPDGSVYWTAPSGEVGRIKPDGKAMTVAKGLMGANSIAFSREGRLFASMSAPGSGIYELDPNGSKTPRAIEKKLRNVTGFAFGPDGKLYAAVSDGKLVAIDVDHGSTHTVAEGFNSPAAVKFDSKGRLFVLDRASGKVFVVSQVTGQKIEYASLEPGIDHLAFDSRGRLFVSNANTAAVDEVRPDGSTRAVSPGGFTDVVGIAVVPRVSGESVYIGNGSGLTEIDGATGAERSVLPTLSGTSALIGAPALDSPATVSSDGSALVVSRWMGKTVQVWDPVKGAVVATYENLAGPVNAIRFRGDIVVAETSAKPARIVRISKAAPAKRTTLATLTGVPAGLAATAQDLWATDYVSGTVLQIVQDGQPLKRPVVVASSLAGPEGLAVAPDGSLLVVQSRAGKLSRIALPSGAISTVAQDLDLGAVGPTESPVWHLDSVAVGPSGAIYIGGDKTNVLYKIEPKSAP